MSSHAVYKRWMQKRNTILAFGILLLALLMFAFGIYELLKEETIDEIDDRRVVDCIPLDKQRKCQIKRTYEERESEDLVNRS